MSKKSNNETMTRKLTSLSELKEEFSKRAVAEYSPGEFVVLEKLKPGSPTLGKAGIVIYPANKKGLLSVGVILDNGSARIITVHRDNVVPLNEDSWARWRHRNINAFKGGSNAKANTQKLV